jgi:D-alanine transaminase
MASTSSNPDVLVYLDGEYVPWGQALVPVEDRAAQFGDAIYEVIRWYRGEPFRLERHLARLARSAEGIMLPLPPLESVESVLRELVRRQGLADAAVYLQISRGPLAPRSHVLPAEPKPFVVAIARPAPPAVRPRPTFRAITVSDDRWARCYLKTTMLLPNTLARERARRRGVDEAIFVRDNFVMEATASNVFVVANGRLLTSPLTNYILPGITREVVLELLELAKKEGIPHAEEPIPASLLDTCDEVFLSGTLNEVTAIVEVDGQRVGTGQPGPIFDRVAAAFDHLLDR